MKWGEFKKWRVREVIRDFLWTISGHQKEIMMETKVDGFRAMVIGAILLLVGIYATLAWTFFFSTVVKNGWLSLCCGMFAGIFIVLFDRALICSLSSGNKSISALSFRFLLAIILGVFLAQPIILKLYEPDIKREAVILIDKKVQERASELDTLYSKEVNSLKSRKEELVLLLTQKQQQLIENEHSFKAEMDGSGGTGHWGYQTVSQKKESIYKKDLAEYEKLRTEYEPEINQLVKKLEGIQDNINAQLIQYKETNQNQGFLIQSEALISLISKDKTHTLRDRYWLLVVILLLIELSALIAKLILETKSYGAKVGFAIEKELKHVETDREIFLAKQETYKRLLLQRETNVIEDFFSKTETTKDLKIEKLTEEWKSSDTQTYKETWDRLNDRLVIHDEN
jgi:hypothetical protein